MKVGSWFPMHVNDVVGESVVTYPHHERTLFVAMRIHDIGMLYLECA
jgi:hypothetical protein